MTGEGAGAAAAHGIVRIQDVAKVVDSVEDVHATGVFNGKPAILVVVFKTFDGERDPDGR